jgi:hypothetical protein
VSGGPGSASGDWPSRAAHDPRRRRRGDYEGASEDCYAHGQMVQDEVQQALAALPAAYRHVVVLADLGTTPTRTLRRLSAVPWAP